MLEIIIASIDWLVVMLLFVAFVFSIFATKNLFVHKFKGDLMRVKRFVFLLLTTGFGCLFIGFLLINFFGLVSSVIFPSIADFFFFVGYFTFVLAFGFFWFNVGKHKLHWKEFFFFMNVSLAVFILLFYLGYNVLVEFSGLSFIAKVLVYYYPWVVSLIFLLTLIIHPLLKAGVISTPLWYISSGFFAFFIGFMLHTYSLWKPAPIIVGLFSSMFLLLASSYFVIGTHVAKKSFTRHYKKTHPRLVKKLTRSV